MPTIKKFLAAPVNSAKGENPFDLVVFLQTNHNFLEQHKVMVQRWLPYKIITRRVKVEKNDNARHPIPGL